jgi:hypothetical protein
MSQFYHARRPIGLALGICPRLGISLARIYLLPVVYISPVVQFHQFNYVLVLEPVIFHMYELIFRKAAEVLLCIKISIASLSNLEPFRTKSLNFKYS